MSDITFTVRNGDDQPEKESELDSFHFEQVRISSNEIHADGTQILTDPDGNKTVIKHHPDFILDMLSFGNNNWLKKAVKGAR